MAINPYVPASATGNGTQVDFTFTFPYIFPTHVKAYLNGVATTAFTFFSTNVLRFTVAPALGVNVLIVRETPGDALAAVIQPGGPLPIVGLNNNFLQSLYYNQETQYDAANQSTAGLQTQITSATNTANLALTQSSNAITVANNASGAVAGKADLAGASFTGPVVFGTTGAVKIPIGTTVQRPTADVGFLRFNTSLGQYEGGNGTTFTPIAGSAKGGGTDAVFFENDITVTTDYTLSSNKNAVSAGPITVATGATITVPSGATWTIV